MIEDTDHSYAEAMKSLQDIIDDKPIPRYIVLPLSDLSAINNLPSNSEVIYPEFIQGSWHWLGNYLKCDRAIGRKADISTHKSTRWGEVNCPECLSDQTCSVSLPHHGALYCTACGLLWLPYPAWCPSCAGFLKKHNSQEEVQCKTCNTVWSTDLVKIANENNDILVEL